MQELLTRDQYNRVQMLEKPVASIPDRSREHPSQNPGKKVAKAGRQTDKTADDTKSGKRALISRESVQSEALSGKTLFLLEKFLLQVPGESISNNDFLKSDRRGLCAAV